MKPRLIHPIEVFLKRRSPENVVDDIFNEIKGEVKYLEPEKISGQISYNVRDRALAAGLGNSPQASGYLLCYTDKWNELGGKTGDLLILSESDICQIVEIRPAGHYKGKAYFQRVFFERSRGT